MRWDMSKEDIGELWSKMVTKITNKLLGNGSKVSEIVFSSVDGSIRVEDEDDLQNFIETAINNREPKIQLRAIIKVRTNSIPISHLETQLDIFTLIYTHLLKRTGAPVPEEHCFSLCLLLEASTQ